MAELLLRSADFPVYTKEGVTLDQVEAAAHGVLSAQFDRRIVIGHVRRYLSSRVLHGIVAIHEGPAIDDTVESYTPPSDISISNRILEEITIRAKVRGN